MAAVLAPCVLAARRPKTGAMRARNALRVPGGHAAKHGGPTTATDNRSPLLSCRQKVKGGD